MLRLAVVLLLSGLAAAAPESLRRGNLVFRYWPQDAGLAEAVARASEAGPPLPGLPDDVLGPDPITVWLAPDLARFDSLTGGRAPGWSAGVALPDRGVIVLPTFAADRVPHHELDRVLRHELAHLALHRYLEPLRIPRWFDEGYARWAAGEWDAESAWMLRLAFATGRAPPLDSLVLGWPGGEIDARVAYLLGQSAVAYLTESGGVDGLRLFLARWKRFGSFDRALRSTYGVTTAQFEEDWREHVKRRYGWAFFLSHSLVFWAIASIMLLALYVRRRIHDRQRLERLRAADPPDSPAYWVDPPELPPDDDRSG